ncbi:MAG: inositol-phosphate transport system substrate-binding protein [Thermosipho sp. (in: thermotogales)]|nr:inositol-phosphate transport system substrate-binding protein [Thermosipho sp. (in: thermotogales)]
MRKEMKTFLNFAVTFMLGVSLLMTGCAKKETKVEQLKGNEVTKKEQPTKIETITITVDSKGSPADSTRGTNIVEAAKELNKILEERKDNRRVEVVHNHVSTGGDDDFNKKFFLACQSGTGADIISNGHNNVALYVKGEYVLQLDELIAKSQFKNDLDKIYPNLWDAAKFNGKTYAIPQDAEIRPLYFRKDVLKKMGWSDEQINVLPEKIKNGEFTLQDMIALGKEAKDKGFVKWGAYHRPSNGPFFTMIVKNFGGKVFNAENGKIVLDKKPVTEALKFFKDLTQDSKITPEGMTATEWRALHKAWVEGEVLFWFGGTWHWAEYQKVAYHSQLGNLSEKYMFDNMGYALTPAATKGGKPITLTQPYVYMINRKTKHPDLAFDLVAIASKPEYNVTHAIESGHLVISSVAAEQPKYKENKFFNSVTYMLDYTITQPNTPLWAQYTGTLYKAVQAVELGKYSPKEAVEWMVGQLKNDVGDMLEVIE